MAVRFDDEIFWKGKYTMLRLAMRKAMRRCLAGLIVLASLVATERSVWAQDGADRGGFTILANLGYGGQYDSFLEESAGGLAGLNFGVGGFLTEDMALLFRVSGTVAQYDAQFLGVSASVTQVSGVAGPTLQFWPSDRFNLEAGGGLGFWDIEGINDRAFGLILGAGVTIFNRGKHNLQVGVEYAPAFTDPGTVHNVGITFGYQFL